MIRTLVPAIAAVFLVAPPVLAQDWPTKPWKTFADVVSASKAKPESVSIGSIGNGTLGHLVLVLAQQMGGFTVTHAP